MGLAGCGLLSSQEVRKRGDPELAVAVKAALVEELGPAAAAIEVRSANAGAISLQGFIDDAESGRRAVRAARSVEGVTEVQEALRIPDA